MVSAVLELIEPATHNAPVWAALGAVLIGASAFTGLDYAVKLKWGAGNGGGLLLAITLDGVPENLALGVALIGTGPLQAAALSGSIFLSNLPEAAGGAKEMAKAGRSNWSVFGLWVATAVALSVSALAGNIFLAGVGEEVLALIRCLAGGAVVASLAIEVFPKGFKEDGYLAGIAAGAGVVLAFTLSSLSSG
jgi:ZIP family zinc transporter